MGNSLSSTPTATDLANFSGCTTFEDLKKKDELDLASQGLKSLPESIGQLRNLTWLRLTHNQLSTLPDSIGNLVNLKWFGVYNNQLSSLPESIGQLTNLTLLSLRENKLSSLPESIGKLRNLLELGLGVNTLPSLPESIGHLTNLTGLSVRNNLIIELPESITRLKNLKSFQIEQKDVIMSIQRAPIGITALPCYSITLTPTHGTKSYHEALKELKLYKYDNENLTDISSLIGKWKACDRINISNNKISTLPDQLSTLTDLCDFNIANNMFSTFPDVLLKMSWLTSLNIASNSFTELPEGITKLAKLANLVIKIEVFGKINIQYAPFNISTLPCYNRNADLKKLKISSNHENKNLTDVSALVAKWRACEQISLAKNMISTLPDGFSLLTNLKELNLSSNMLNDIPSILLKMTWLGSLDISGHSFTELPEGITKLVKLENLVIRNSSGDRTIQRAPIGIMTLPCFRTNGDLKMLQLYGAAPAPVTTQPSAPIPIDFPEELKHLILSVAPTFNVADKLGEGGQATVYKGKFQGKSVAIKIMKQDEDLVKQTANEVILTKKIPHQNIINIIGVYLGPEGMSIVMELAKDSLEAMIDKRKGPLSPIEIITFGKQIADALNYCVTRTIEEPIHHRDLKTENVLIVNGQAKLADFGLAQARQRTGFSSHPSRTKDGRGEVAGTIHWQGPEIYNRVSKGDPSEDTVGHRGEKSDVYAFGLILWSMATGHYPFSGKKHPQITSDLLRGERPEIPTDIHRTLAHIIRACWRQNYKLRPRFGDIAAVLAKCGAGQLDVVSKEYLDRMIPILYSPVKDMLTGELYQYLTEQGISRSVEQKVWNDQILGREFAIATLDVLMGEFGATEAEAHQLVRLQKLASDSSSPSTSITTPDSMSQAPQPPAASRLTPPKPIIEMDTDELVAYLRGQKGIVESFLSGLQQEGVNGEVFLHIMDSETLAEPPFNMKSLQLKATLKAIEEIKLL